MQNQRLLITLLLLGVAVLSALLGFALGRSGASPSDQTYSITVGAVAVLHHPPAEDTLFKGTFFGDTFFGDTVCGGTLCGALRSLRVNSFAQHADIGQRAMPIGVV